MPGKTKFLDVPLGRLVMAVSDGELNNPDLGGRGSDQSLNSLPSVQTAGLGSELSVASWAVSFERLLQDSLGVEYFTEFLKKEYSAENIYFWKSCEKYQNIPAEDTEQLKQESRQIYNEYLSSTSLCPVNVDQQAVITEEMLEKPTPDLFKVQQLQIFNLMKFDSYSRFVKSPLYQECMLSEVEGRPLPNLNFSPTSLNSGCAAITTGVIKHDSGNMGSTERDADSKPIKYCCVYLPDGTASLTAVKPGLNIREMLAGVCEKRGYNSSEVKVYLAGNDQMGETQALDQAASVKEMAGQTLVLQVHSDMKDVTHALGSTTDAHSKKEPIREKPEMRLPKLDLHHWSQKEADNDHHTSLTHRRSGITPDKQKIFQHNQDVEGLVEMLNRVQNTRADDQRGLLCKDDLILPEFLQLPTDEKCDHCQTTCKDTAIEKETVPSCPDMFAENCNENNISSGSTSVDAVCGVPSNLENTNASTSISNDSHDTASTVMVDNVTTAQMEKLCLEEKNTVL